MSMNIQPPSHHSRFYPGAAPPLMTQSPFANTMNLIATNTSPQRYIIPNVPGGKQSRGQEASRSPNPFLKSPTLNLTPRDPAHHQRRKSANVPDMNAFNNSNNNNNNSGILGTQNTLTSNSSSSSFILSQNPGLHKHTKSTHDIGINNAINQQFINPNGSQLFSNSTYIRPTPNATSNSVVPTHTFEQQGFKNQQKSTGDKENELAQSKSSITTNGAHRRCESDFIFRDQLEQSQIVSVSTNNYDENAVLVEMPNNGSPEFFKQDDTDNSNKLGVSDRQCMTRIAEESNIINEKSSQDKFYPKIQVGNISSMLENNQAQLETTNSSPKPPKYVQIDENFSQNNNNYNHLRASNNSQTELLSSSSVGVLREYQASEIEIPYENNSKTEIQALQDQLANQINQNKEFASQVTALEAEREMLVKVKLSNSNKSLADLFECEKKKNSETVFLKSRELDLKNLELEKAKREIEEFRKSIDELERKIIIVLEENTRVNEMIHNQNEYYGKIRENQKKLEVENKEIISQLTEKTNEIQFLRARLNEFNNYESMESDSGNKFSQFNSIRGKIGDLERKIDLLVIENGKLNNVIEIQVDEIESIHEHYAQEFNALQLQDKEDTKRIDELSKLLEEERNQQQNSSAQQSKSPSRIDSFNIEAMQNQVNQVLYENDKLIKTLREKQSQLAEAREVELKVKELLNENDSLNELVVQTTNDITILKEQLEKAQMWIEENCPNQKQRRSSLDSQEIDFLRSEHSQLQSQNASLEDELKRARAIITDQQRDLEKYRDLDRQVEIVVDENEKLQEYFSLKNNEEKQYNQIFLQKQLEVKELQQNLMEHQQTLKQFQEQFQTIIQENNQLNFVIANQNKFQEESISTPFHNDRRDDTPNQEQANLTQTVDLMRKDNHNKQMINNNNNLSSQSQNK